MTSASRRGRSFSSKELSGKVGAAGRHLKVATTNGGIDLKKG